MSIKKISFHRTASTRLILLLGCMMILHSGITAQELGKLDLDKLDQYIGEAMADWQVPGLSIAIVSNDSIVFARGYGVKEYGKPGKVDENTIFSIASITKGFTSTALAMLDDAEKIDWDDPVRKYLPEFSFYNSWVSDEIRIRDLLCHRSGLETFSGDLTWFETDYSREELVYRIRYLEPAYGFRYRFGYSNLMYLAAGEIIPRAGNMSWDDYIDSSILQPLGMDRTFLRQVDFRDEPNIAMPHHVDLLDDHTYVLPFLKLEQIAPALGMSSSVMDIASWIRFQLHMGNWNDTQLVSPENLWETREMHTVRPLDMGSSRVWPSRHFTGYGLGWELFDYHGWKVIGHEGGTDGMLSRLVIVPQENFGFIILTNSISALPVGLEYFILDQYYQGQSYDWSSIYLRNSKFILGNIRQEWEAYLANADRTLDPSKDIEEYTGVYSCDLYGDVNVSLESETLVLDFLPSARLIGDLEPFSKDTFLINLRDMPFLPQGTVKFHLDGDGKVSGLEVDIPNPDLDFTELNLKKRNE